MNKKQELGVFSGKSILSNKELNKYNIPHKDGWVTGSLIRSGFGSYYICNGVGIRCNVGLTHDWWAEVDKNSIKRGVHTGSVDNGKDNPEQLNVIENRLKEIDDTKNNLIVESFIIDKDDYEWMKDIINEHISFKKEYVKYNGKDKHTLIKSVINSEKKNKNLQTKLEDKYYELSRIEDEIFTFIATNCEKVYEKWGNKPYTDPDYDLSFLLNEVFDELEDKLLELREIKENFNELEENLEELREVKEDLETENSQIKNVYRDRCDDLDGLLEHFNTSWEELINE